MKISVIYPVCSYPNPRDEDGRAHPYLLSSLDSLLRAGPIDFEILIGVDGYRKHVIDLLEFWREMHGLTDSQMKVFVLPFSGSFGNYQRNFLISRASGSHISFMDQDDEYTAGAFSAISEIINRNGNFPLMFKMRVFQARTHTCSKESPITLWRSDLPGVLQMGLVGGHMFVAPNEPENLGTWPVDIYEADYHFIQQSAEKFSREGKKLIWVDFVLANVRPWAYKKNQSFEFVV